MAVAIPLWSSTIFALSTLFPYAVADVDAPCYQPNGLVAPGFFPCDPTAYITSCCPNGYTCFSNSMCVVTAPSTANDTHPIGTSLRGACTNPVWNNPVCGDYCLADDVLDGSLHACGNDKFCCTNDDSCTCSKGSFDIKPGRAQTIIGIEGLAYTETSIIIPATTALATTTTLMTRLSTMATTSNAASTSPIESTILSEPIKKSPTDSPGVKAGIALGVIFGVATIAILAWYIYQQHIKKAQSNPHSPQPTSFPVRPPTPNDPYIQGNATNLAFNPPMASVNRLQYNKFDAGDAPIGNEYERNAPSRGPLSNSVTSIGSGTLHGGWNGTRGPLDRLSIVSAEDDRFTVRGRPGELAR